MTGKSGKPELFETMRITAGVPEHFDLHCGRMLNSAKTFGYVLKGSAFGHMVDLGLTKLPEGADARMRITLFDDPCTSMRFQTKVLAGVPEEVSLELSGERVRSDDPLIRHKTTRREKYDAAQAAAEERGLWDGILLNEKGEITETGRANIIALVDDGLITPPVECGLLPGIIRKVLLDGGLVKEGLLRPEDLARSRALFVTNSLIRIAAVSSLKGTSYEPCRAFLGKTRDRLLEVLLRNSLGAKIICFPSPVET